MKEASDTKRQHVFVRKLIRVSPDIPYQSESLFGNVAWSMVSKAADKSSKIRTVTSPLSISIIISLCTFSSADSVECCFLSADCNGLDK